MRKAIYLAIFLKIILSSCGGNPTEESEPKEESESTQQEEVKVDGFSNISVDFDQNKFDDSVHIELLKELKICNVFQKDINNYLEPACLPKFFKIFPLSEKIAVKDAFLVLIKSNVGGIKLRRVIAFVRERGELVKVNGYVATLIGMKKGSGGYYDLMLRFNDNIDDDIIYYNCIFRWNGTKYEFLETDAIEGVDPTGPWRQTIKNEYKDSISWDIYNNRLLKNKMII
jgi:hypothetical protein